MAENSAISGEPRRALEPGTVLNNNYRILDRIGEGGMGAVYRAANIFMEEDHVAIKVIRAEQADDDLFRQMFGKEVKAMLRLNNPRLVSYRTFAHDPALDLSFIVTEFIDGPSLKSLIGTRHFSPQELLSLLSELAIGLRAAHRVGIVHRDMAPDNVLLEDGDIARPKIIDFGIVKDTDGDGTTIIGSGFAGKYGFVAPEQLGEPDYDIGPWTDIYSLALVIAGLARGKSIPMGNTPGAAIRARQEVPDLSAMPEPMRALLADMLATHPDDRIRSAEAVLERVGPIAAELENWGTSHDGELEETVVLAPAGAAVPLADPYEDEDEVTEVTPETPPQSLAIAQTFEEEEDFTDYRDEAESDRRSGGKFLWIFLGLIAAGALAVVGGMLLGDYVSIPGGGDEPVVSGPTAAPTTPVSNSPEPIEPPREILPQVALSIGLAPDAPRVAIAPDSWVRQQDLPRQMFGNTPVTGVIAANLSVARDGSVTDCTIGGTSRVEPQRMLSTTARSVCSALRDRARFEPLPEPSTGPAPLPTITATIAGEPPLDPGVPKQEVAPPQAAPGSGDTLASPAQDTQVFVRVRFQTVQQETEAGAEDE